MKIPRQRRSVFALGILTAIAGTFPALASPFYTYTIVVRAGVDLDGSGFVASSISPRVSLNDSGAVAFMAENLSPDSGSSRREEAHFNSEFGSREATAKLAAKERIERKNLEGGLFLSSFVAIRRF